MEYCNEKQREAVIEKILPDLVTISFDMYGTYAVQKMIEYLNETQVRHSCPGGLLHHLSLPFCPCMRVRMVPNLNDSWWRSLSTG